MQALDEVIRKRIKETQAKQKKCYDAKQQKRVKKFSFSEGDRVLLRNSLKDTRKGGRLTAAWTGPYTLKTILPKGVCILTGIDGMELKSKQNMARLKPYRERPADNVQQQPVTTDASSVDGDAADVGHGMLCFMQP